MILQTKLNTIIPFSSLVVICSRILQENNLFVYIQELQKKNHHHIYYLQSVYKDKKTIQVERDREYLSYFNSINFIYNDLEGLSWLETFLDKIILSDEFEDYYSNRIFRLIKINETLQYKDSDYLSYNNLSKKLEDLGIKRENG